MSTASKGSRFERALIKLLKEHGFSTIRGAASKGDFAGVGKVDIVATKLSDMYSYEVEMVLCQCKVKGIKKKKK